ncbi:MAG TPA: hypothetical protein VNY73_06705 [Bacteroidia bacterium]|jgi:hypothetical protein|nr:hypothetical protein [Bacteroidia bacterium]
MPKPTAYFVVACWLFTFVLTAQVKQKIMVVPFEPKMYMSQVDHKINAETKLTQKQIKENFRKGVNEEVSKALKKSFDVLDLMKDTAKYAKEIFAIYRSLTYSYDKVPDQANYKAPVAEKDKKNHTIKNGQLIVETDPNAHFMNAKIKSAALVPGLYAKYKTTLFLFINQLDILSSPVVSNDLGTASERVLTLHYTVYTVDAREINSGICSLKFPGDVNTPSKMISSYISKMGAEITDRINLALTKEKEVEKKKK